jgi:hypothetical protein
VKAERALTLARDAVSTLVGAAGIGWQLWTGKVDPTAMLVCAGLLGIPGALSLLSLRPTTPGAPDTPVSSSPSPPGSPPQPSSSPSSSST